MVLTETLYREIDQQHISFDYFSLPNSESISLVDPYGHCYIGLDPEQVANAADERVKLAHETGHCVTGAFYNRYSELNCITKQEHQANDWAVKKLLPWEELDAAIKSELEIWQLADLFHVTEDFVRCALMIYAEEGRYIAP